MQESKDRFGPFSLAYFHIHPKLPLYPPVSNLVSRKAPKSSAERPLCELESGPLSSVPRFAVHPQALPRPSDSSHVELWDPTPLISHHDVNRHPKDTLKMIQIFPRASAIPTFHAPSASPSP